MIITPHVQASHVQVPVHRSGSARRSRVLAVLFAPDVRGVPVEDRDLRDDSVISVGGPTPQIVEELLGLVP